jgi:hypothetical protein
MRYSKPLLLFIAIYLMTTVKGLATGDSLYYLLPTDTVILSIEQYGEKIFTHRLEKKQTLYSLAHFYGLSVEELYYYNPGLKETSAKLHQGSESLFPTEPFGDICRMMKQPSGIFRSTTK